MPIFGDCFKWILITWLVPVCGQRTRTLLMSVDAWLDLNLTRGKVHVTDYLNACG